LGICATPELFFAVGAKKFPCGVMITASHSPNGQTGFKFCDGQGKVYGLKTGLLKLQKLAEKLAKSNVTESVSEISSGKIEKLLIKQDYQKFVLSLIKSTEVKNLKIVLDASSGSGADLAEVVFKALPLKKVLVNFKSGDKYPDHGLNPLLPENQKVISTTVKREHADLGVIFDGDADRSVFFDETGKFIEPYYLNCLLAQIVLSKKKESSWRSMRA
jgi:phosphomannomutase